MNETDIRNQVSILWKATVEHNEDTAKAVAFNLLAQFLVDVNRIASHFERERSHGR
jgi:hypothetical protein